ncbi:acyl carrier protein [Actinoplanes sp. NPDC049668]|uniref:acyl carrier protein n=1 Tax=unclassified Actinoplanes TaxID=2626549 RepID=UPI0033B5C7D7
MESVTGPTLDEIVDVVVRLLALERGQEEAEIREELEEGGAELPIDSLRLVEILTRLEQELGVEIPADVDSAKAMRSVRDFATIVRDAVVTGDRSA